MTFVEKGKCSKPHTRSPVKEVQKVTCCDHDTGNVAAARTAFAIPQRRKDSMVRRKNSIVRTLVARHRVPRADPQRCPLL